MWLANDSLRFVAAAGNNGEDVLHFPAAWRDPDVTLGLAGNVDPTIADDIEDVHTGLSIAMYAVGSVEPNGRTSSYSNCGDWVNAAAFGSKQVGEYPSSPSDYAVWSGTSFATANFTAALVSGLVDPDPLVSEPITGARMINTPNGLGCAL